MGHKNLEIDRLRGISILMIAYCHFCRIFFPSFILLTEHFGTTLIEIFLAISGFVISNIIVEKIDKAKKENSGLGRIIKAFYVRRLIRVHPISWVVFLFVLICSAIFVDGNLFSTPLDNLKSALYLITSTYNFFFLDNYQSMALAPYWTLSIEEQFYFIFPIFLIFTPGGRARVWILIAMLLLFTFIIRPLTLEHFPIEGLFFTQSRLDALIYGCLVHYIYRQPWFDSIKLKADGNRWLRCACVVILVAILFGISATNLSDNIIIPIAAFIAAILVLLASFERKVIVFPFPIQFILDWAGYRAYSLYLLHVPIFLFAVVIGTEFIQPWLALVLLFIATELLFRLVEQPTRNFGRRISNRMMQSHEQKQPI